MQECGTAGTILSSLYTRVSKTFDIGKRGSRYQYIPQASLLVHTGPLYQYKEVARALLSVHCMDN
jgi:hypothetical protein